ncbi:MAG: adenylate kinase family protein [Thermoplasma acidophilum]|nr:adenylate kinase family protein [Thermoplasma acidophilum]
MKGHMRGKLICISGIPGTGKSTICGLLKDLGYNCVEGNVLASKYGCISGDEVDIDCLSDRIRSDGFTGIVAAHYAHLLPCNIVIILEADESALRQRMVDRGYSSGKIEENLDAQRSDTIYAESLELLPANRIFRIDNADLNRTLSEILKIIDG